MNDRRRSSLFGREKELLVLERAIEGASSGHLEVVLFEGEPGIGKSRLLAEAASKAEIAGFSTWTAAFDEMEGARSFGPLADALDCSAHSDDPRRVKIADALHSSVAAGGDPGYHFRIADALVDLAEEEAIRQPRLLILEDMHWADPSSLYTVKAVIRRMAYMPFLLIGGMRLLPRSSDLQSLLATIRDEGWVPMILDELDRESVSALVEEVAGQELSPGIADRISTAGGNPLFVVELVDALSKEDSRNPDADTRPLPPDLRSTILGKINFLSEESVELLKLAAILGSSFAASDLAAAKGRPLVDLMPCITESLTARIIEEDQDREKIRFRHDLIRESLYYDLPNTIRKGLHLEVARRLLGAGAPSVQVAEHFMLGAERGDREAISALRRTASDASLGPETRIKLLQRARELHREDDPELFASEADLAGALVWGGRVDDAVALALSLLQRTSDVQMRRQLRRLIARALRIGGRYVELMDVTDEWFKGDLEVEERALLTAIRAAAAATQSAMPLDQVSLEVEGALAVGERMNNDEIRVAALTSLERIRYYQGRHPEQISVTRRAVAIVDREPTSDLRSYHPHLWLGQALMHNLMFEEAEQVILDGLRHRESIGTAWDLAGYQAVLATIYWQTGRWDEAVAAAESCLDAEFGFSNSDEAALYVLAVIAIYRGRSDEARARMDAVDRLPAGTNVWGLQALAGTLLAVVAKDAATALPLIRAAHESGTLDPDALVEVTAFLLASGERGLAESIVEAFEVYVSDNSNLHASLHTLAARAVLADDPAGYKAALDGVRGHSWTWALLAAEAAACYARNFLSADAKQSFEEALDTFERLDAQLLVSRIRDTMRSHGIRPGVAGKRGRPKTGWEALTDAEKRVVELAADGLTNPRIAERLFLSRYTVQSHLKSVFQKLGITSRMQLSAQVREHSVQVPKDG
ncbi:MAG TPA: AAA family ATPase [Actinomycetota bacterium]|nr:AAA family ATPase [Actinomycetota bacterium]